MQRKIGFIGSIATLVTFSLVLILMQKMSLTTSLGLLLAFIFAVSVAGYFLRAAQIQQEKLHHPRFQLQNGEKLLTVSKYHKIMLLPGVFCLMVGGILCIASLMLWLYHPAISFKISPLHFAVNGEDKVTTARQISFPIWEVPIIFGLVIFYPALATWQRWKWSSRSITSKRLILLREPSIYMFWLGREYDPVQLDQISDVNDKAGVLGSFWGWGTVEIERVRKTSADDVIVITLRLVPHCQEFAETLRSVCPLLNPDAQIS